MRRMLGAEFTDELRRTWRALEPEFERYVVGFLAGEIWPRPRLPLKLRSLVTVAALGALGKKEGLALNIRMALNNGASREEVLETLLQLALYAGFPAAWEALVVAGQVFGQMPKRSRGRGSGSKLRARQARRCRPAGLSSQRRRLVLPSLP